MWPQRDIQRRLVTLGIVALAIGIGLLLKYNHDVDFANWERAQQYSIDEPAGWLLPCGWVAVALGATCVVAGYATDRRHADLSEHFRQCEFCAERIRSVASVCRYCGRDVQVERSDHRRSGCTFSLLRATAAGLAIVLTSLPRWRMASARRVSVAAAVVIALGVTGAIALAVTMFAGGGTTQPTDSTASDAVSTSTPCPDGFLGVHIDAIRDSGRGSVSVAGKLVNHFPVAVAPLSVEVVGRTASGLQAKTSASLAESVLAAGDALAPGGTLDFVSNVVVFRYTTGQFNDVVNEPTASVDPGDHGLASLLIRGCNSVPGRSDTLVRVQPE